MFYRSLYSRIFLRKFRLLSVYFYQDLYQSIYSFAIYQLNFLTIYQFYLSINLEDITLNSLHTTLVFQAEDEVVACPPKTPQSYPKRAEDKVVTPQSYPKRAEDKVVTPQSYPKRAEDKVITPQSYPKRAEDKIVTPQSYPKRAEDKVVTPQSYPKRAEDKVVTPQSYPKRAEDKRQLCPPLETLVSFEKNLL